MLLPFRTTHITTLCGTAAGSSDQWNSTYTTVNSLSDSWEESADIIPTITNYLSTNNVLLLSATVMGSLSVGGTIYTSVTSEAVLKYTENIGNNISSSFNIVHNFNTKDIAISVYDNSTNIQSYPEINVIDNNYIKVNFAFIPNVNAYRVLIIGTKPSNLIAAYGNTSYVTAIEKYQFKNSNFNILSGYYAVDTSSGPVRGILPSTPSLGDTLVFIDTYNTWATYNFVIKNNGNPIDSLVDDLSANINGFTFRLTWVGNPAGWNIY